MKQILKLGIVVIVLVVLAALVISAGCVDGDKSGDITKVTVKCYNGNFVGTEENGIMSFKGIPYAQPPVGELRWKAPQSVDASEETFDATRFGKASLQPVSRFEPASSNRENLSEDCLTLNVWTTGKSDVKKPVMVWFHGGAYCLGSSMDSLYDGSCILAEYPDVVVVTANYRLGPLGYIDFSGVEGGEAFPTSGYNGLLDQIEALKWVQQNIEAFGGDPNNVTIFGYSAGGGSVSCLLVAKEAEGLFQHVIAHSGTVNLTTDHDRYAELDMANVLLKRANASSVDELMKLSEDELYNIYVDTRDGISLVSVQGAPLRAEESPVTADPYQAILDGAGKDVDLIIGTTSKECNYFIYMVCNPSKIKEKIDISDEHKGLFSKVVLNTIADRFLKPCTDEEKGNLEAFMALDSGKDEFWKKTDLLNEIYFRSPAIQVAVNHELAGGTGKTYMYYFSKKNADFDWLGASHGSELPYVFHNLGYGQQSVSGPIIPEPVDPELADMMSGMWVNFAKTGDPSYGGVKWPEYSLENRETLFFNEDGTISVENDPFQEARELILPLMYHYMGL